MAAPTQSTWQNLHQIRQTPSSVVCEPESKLATMVVANFLEGTPSLTTNELKENDIARYKATKLCNLDPELPGLFERILAAGKAPVIVAHFDHIGETSEEAIKNVRKLRDGDLQFLNQAVLLSKVNDDPEVPAATFAKR
jgi:hypothetical protein